MNPTKSMVLAALVATAAHADADAGLLAKQLQGVKVTLSHGLKAAATSGKPISGKFEVEDGKLQLSVYTAKGQAFSEVVVDLQTGKVEKTEAITGGEDLAAAKTQGDAMRSAHTSLDAAVRKAESANKGYRAVSVVPSAPDGHPTAEVTLIKGAESKRAAVPLG